MAPFFLRTRTPLVNSTLHHESPGPVDVHDSAHQPQHDQGHQQEEPDG